MFLKDRVLPKHINDFIINKENTRKLQTLFTKDFLSNLYIYGPEGCGKYSLFIKNLEFIVDKQINIFPKTINITSQWSSIKETTVLSSEYHFEINLSKYANNKNNLFSIIDALTESAEINSKLHFKLILIRNIQTASPELVKFIKQKSEQYTDYIRFIIIGNTCSNNLAILSGSFFCLRMPSPTLDQIVTTLKPITKKKIKQAQLVQIINESNFNLSKIFAKVEMLLLTNFYKTRLELTTEQLMKLLFDKKISNLYEVREVIYEYQTNNEDIGNLLKNLLLNIIHSGKLNAEKLVKITRIVSDINENQQVSYKEIIHIEYGLFRIFKLIHS